MATGRGPNAGGSVIDRRYYDLQSDPNEQAPIELDSATEEAVAAHQHLKAVLERSGAEAVWKQHRKNSDSKNQ